jgi:hypothetical protein
VVGGEYLPEALRSYFCDLIGGEPGHIISSMGRADIGLHLLWETEETIQLRRTLDLECARKMCGVELPTVPCFMTYDPAQLHVETVESELIFTCLEPERPQPVIRYNTHDVGGLIPLDAVPLLWLYGRKGAPEISAIADAIASLGPHLCQLTGGFCLDRPTHTLMIQLAPDCLDVDVSVHEKLHAELERCLGRTPELRFWRYLEYPYADLSPWLEKFRRTHP